MLGSANQWIRRPSSLWLNINSLSTVHSTDEGPQTKGNMDKVILLKKIGVPQSKVKRFDPCFYESFCY